MRAGKLDRSITIERATSTVNEFGTVSDAWAPVATVRAQLIQTSTEEFLKAYGTNSERVSIFRIRWREGLAVADRVTYQGQAFDIKEIKELGRREGIDLRCLAV